MAIWPFNRKKRNGTGNKVPQEVEQYYQSERRDRVGVAWLLAGLTLVLTVLIVLGLFFGGRWVYRKIANKDNGNQTAQTNQPAEQSPASQQPSSNNGSSENTTPPSPSSGNTSSPPASQPTPSQGNVNAPTQSNNPSSVSTKPTQTNLANTGPGETIAVFVLVSLAGYLGYSTYLRKKLY